MTVMTDLIDRQAALDALGERPMVWVGSDYGLGARNQYDSDRLAIETLPPAQQWIPCSERMPEEREWIGTKKFGTTISNEVYVTFEAPDGERFAKHISFQNGKLSSVDEQRMKVWYKGAKPIAWCPIPEPWKGEEK